jgi:hypothetical protein
MLFPAACVIAMLGGIESLLSALVADSMTNGKHNSNKERIGLNHKSTKSVISDPTIKMHLKKRRI